MDFNPKGRLKRIVRYRASPHIFCLVLCRTILHIIYFLNSKFRAATYLLGLRCVKHLVKWSIDGASSDEERSRNLENFDQQNGNYRGMYSLKTLH